MTEKTDEVRVNRLISPEGKFRIGEKEWTAVMSFSVIREIESNYNALVVILHELVNRQLHTTLVAELVSTVIRASNGGEGPSVDEVGEHIQANGVSKIRQELQKLVLHAEVGPAEKLPKARKRATKRKPSRKKTTTTRSNSA